MINYQPLFIHFFIILRFQFIHAVFLEGSLTIIKIFNQKSKEPSNCQMLISTTSTVIIECKFKVRTEKILKNIVNC